MIFYIKSVYTFSIVSAFVSMYPEVYLTTVLGLFS